MGRKKVVTETNPDAVRHLIRDMHQKSRNTIEVGLLQGVASEASIFKATINIYGVPGGLGGWLIPPRDFMTAASMRYPSLVAQAKAPVFSRQNRRSRAGGGTKNIRQLVNEYLAEYARLAAAEIKFQIVDPTSDASYPRNAPSTVRKKGFDNPLYETGSMAADISYRVRQPSGKIIAQGKP